MQMFVDVVDAISADHFAPRSAAFDELNCIDEDTLHRLRTQGLQFVGAMPSDGDQAVPLLGLLAVSRIARASASVAALVASTHDGAMAYEPATVQERVGQTSSWAPTLVDLCQTGTGSVAVGHDGRWRIEGNAWRVERAATASSFVVMARGEDGGEVVLEVERTAEGIGIDGPLKTTGLGGLDVAAVSFDDVHAEVTARLTARTPAVIRLHHHLSSAAVCLGIAFAAIEASTKYAEERFQFGQALMKFAEIRGHLNDMETQARSAAAIMWTIAQSGFTARNSNAAAQAALTANRAVLAITRTAVQVHGGYGYMRESGIERLMRDAVSTGARLGGSESLIIL
jgi:alkylation response protein AidB-like acyl-CoA dehydrogenase